MTSTGIRRCLFLFLALTLIILLYHQVVQALWVDWTSRGDDSYGLILVALAGYLVFQRRRQVPWRTSEIWPPGIGVLGLGVFLFMAGQVAFEYYSQRTSLPIVLLGLMVYLYGPKALKALLLPAVFIVMAVPFPTLIVNSLTLPLKGIVSVLATDFLHLLGIPIFREGNILQLVGITLEVVNACSGIRSIFALLVIALYLSVDMPSIPQRIVLVLMTVPLAITTNALRIAATAIVNHYGYTRAALDFYHNFSGWLIFMLALVLLLALRMGITKVSEALTSDRGHTTNA